MQRDTEELEQEERITRWCPAGSAVKFGDELTRKRYWIYSTEKTIGVSDYNTVDEIAQWTDEKLRLNIAEALERGKQREEERRKRNARFKFPMPLVEKS